MTNREWQRSRDPRPMLKFLSNGNARKLKLLSCAYCRRAWDAFHDPRSRHAVEVAERAVEGRVTGAEVNAAERAARAAQDETGDAAERAAALLLLDDGWQTAAHVAEHAGTALANYAVGPMYNFGMDYAEWRSIRSKEEQAQVGLVRDIFGNPFHAVAFSRSWLSDTAVSIAQGMYESRDFSAMPILADALQDAGCDNEYLLNHCRGRTTVHVRGCWVADLVLGKE